MIGQKCFAWEHLLLSHLSLSLAASFFIFGYTTSWSCPFIIFKVFQIILAFDWIIYSHLWKPFWQWGEPFTHIYKIQNNIWDVSRKMKLILHFKICKITLLNSFTKFYSIIICSSLLFVPCSKMDKLHCETQDFLDVQQCNILKS